MSIELTVNETPVVVDLSRLPADITLNTYIRDHVGLSGTKFMCLEGGCGACICVVRGTHPVSGDKQTWAVNSCLTLLNVCDGWDVITIEGIGNKMKGYHPIQKQLARLNGSQCGYCSPGMVMNMYGLLKSKRSKVTMEEVENAFGGNICRCTGYRPIMDAMKTFAIDNPSHIECKDIEDLVTTCPKTGKNCSGTCQRQQYTFPNGVKWFWPRSLKELFVVINIFGDQSYTLVAGNTAHGVYRRMANISNFVDVNRVSELHGHKIDDDLLTLGANLSLSECMEVFQKAADKPGFEYCNELYNHFNLIANVPVRNMGTLAGNLMIKHDHPEFPSDIFIAFEALNVTVVVGNDCTVELISLDKFLKMDMRGKIILFFHLKPYPQAEFIFKSFKIMPRAQNAHAYVNSAFLLGMSPISGKVLSSRICFGGINPNFIHASSTENIIVGKDLFANSTLRDVFNSLWKELEPDLVLPDASAEYRKTLACGLLYKFLLSIAPADRVPVNFISGGSLLKHPISSGIQTYETTTNSFPITEPLQKVEAIAQCSGEALYMNDLPPQPKQVWCAFVHATKVGAEILKIDPSTALNIPGVIAFYSAKDVPGVNSFVGTKFPFMDGEEEIFCAGKIKYHNQPAGMIVAETNDLANFAASKVMLTYSEGTSKVLATIHDVLKENRGDRIQDAVVSPVKELKPISGGIQASGSLMLGHQYHYTIEPHTAVVIPVEGGLEVYSSTQWMDITQHAIAQCVQMKMSEVQLKVRRLGGGFGGKVSRSNHVACAAALAAVKLNRPVRFVQTIESMISIIGKRYPCYNEYEFSVDSRGKILSIQNLLYEDAGYLTSENAVSFLVEPSVKNCYDFTDNFKLDAKIVLTDTPNNTWCRAPTSLEGIAMIETIMEHIAFEVRRDPADVRLENMTDDNKARELLERFLKSTDYKQRRTDIDEFNDMNRWRKKGIGISLMNFDIVPFGPFAATVAIYQGDGTVVISHGGIEMGHGLNTKAVQVAAYMLQIPADMIRIESSNTVNGANAIFSGASITSESVCYAIRKACETLLERLRPIRESMEDYTWLSLLAQAHTAGVNLIANEHCKYGDMPAYSIYGLSLTEMEVDILTGNYFISRVDILEDTGESINPAIDVGQIEGAFVMGLGYYLTEQPVTVPETGEILTNRTWNYKTPGCKDIPIDFRIELLQKSPNPAGFMRSKSAGEPAICMAVSALFAIQHALQSARNDAGHVRKFISLGAPTTPEHVALNAGTNIKQFSLK